MKIRFVLMLFFIFSLVAGLHSCSIFQIQSLNDSTIVDSEEKSKTNEKDSLVIWWQQSFVSGSNEEIARLVREWEKSSGIKTTLLLKSDSINKQLYSSIAKGNAPDLTYIPNISETIPKLAWEGKLADVSDIIEPIKDLFNPITLDGANYLNKKRDRRSFYAVPIAMFTYNIHYWKPYLDRLGLKSTDIPQEWQSFWIFWQEVRDQLHQLGEKDITSFCINLNKNSNDGINAVLHFLHGHNADIFDNEGRLILDRPKNRQGMINAFSQLSDLYRNGYIPAEAMEWEDADNNFQFLDRQCLLVGNTTLSIPATQKHPDIPYTQKEKNRYVNEIVTLSSLPSTVNGSRFKLFVGLSRIVIPENSDRKATAKQFLSYLLQPENLQLLIEKMKGRSLPSMPELLNTPFWQNPDDPHFAAMRVISAGNIQPYPNMNPVYAEIRKQRIFTTALERVIRDGISSEEAADNAIARIKQIINQYDQ